MTSAVTTDMKEKVVFLHDSPYGDYKRGEYGFLVGFCRGGDDVPYGIVRKANGMYVMATLASIMYCDETRTERKEK